MAYRNWFIFSITEEKKGCGGAFRFRRRRLQRKSNAKMATAARMGMMTAAAISPLDMLCLWAGETSGRAVFPAPACGIPEASEAEEESAR